jgi:hypothetical protein
MRVERKSKSNTSNDRDNWNNLKIIQKVLEQHTGKARNRISTENSHIGHITHTSESTKKCKIIIVGNNITCTIKLTTE